MACDSNYSRVHFFEKQVHDEKWKKTMAGKNEDKVIDILNICGFCEDVDYKRQFPFGGRFVFDFAFVNEQVAIEVDGVNHNTKKQQRKDFSRDRYLRENNWVPIRIKDEELFGYKQSFYKSLIKEIVLERRKQYKKGILFESDLSKYEEDYE